MYVLYVCKNMYMFVPVFWIRMQFVSWIWIPNADPDSAADKISSKSQKNSYNTELFD